MSTPRRSFGTRQARANLAGCRRAQWGLNTPPTLRPPPAGWQLQRRSAPTGRRRRRPRPVLREGGPQPGQLGGRRGDGQRAAQVEVGVNALVGAGLDDFGDSVVEVTLKRDDASRPPPGRVADRRASRARPPGMRPESQPPLRPLAPKPACSASTTAMRSPGSAPARRPGRPQPGVAGADDADVPCPLNPPARPDRRWPERLLPEAALAVDHAGTLTGDPGDRGAGGGTFGSTLTAGGVGATTCGRVAAGLGLFGSTLTARGVAAARRLSNSRPCEEVACPPRPAGLCPRRPAPPPVSAPPSPRRPSG